MQLPCFCALLHSLYNISIIFISNVLKVPLEDCSLAIQFPLICPIGNLMHPATKTLMYANEVVVVV